MRRESIRKKQIILIITSTLVVAILAGLVIWKLAARNDRLKFAEVETINSDITTQLVRHLGDKAGTVEERNECFNTEQGPFDNGRLWCQVATVIRLNSDVDYDVAGEEFLKQARSRGYATHSSRGVFGARYWFETGKGMSCVLDGIGSQGEGLSSSTKKPFNDNDAPALAVTCADRARARHYRYTD